MPQFTKTYFCRFSLLLFILICQNDFISAATAADRYAANSVLSQGDWYKIKISGGNTIYKLTYEDLKKIGLSNPANVKIYGYGGWMLDQDFSKPYVDDLPEVSIWMSNEPSKFGSGDYILFYGRGDIKWEYDSKNKEFVHNQNPYSFDSYYFITESSSSPSLMGSQPSLVAGSSTVNTFNDYALHELEEINVGRMGTGREFYGESFLSKNSRDFKFSLPGATSDEALIRYDFISRAELNSGFLTISLNGTKLKTSPTLTTTEYYTYATQLTDHTVTTTQLKDENTINLNFERKDNQITNVHLNYIRINYKRSLKPYGAVTLFRNTNLSDNLTFRITDASSSVMVFDVTENFKVNRVSTTASGNTLTFSADNSNIREYAMVDISQLKNIPVPDLKSVEKVSNQNLHALSSADMVIIVPQVFQQYAEELAQLHADDSGLRSIIVNPEKIYNEFSSGKPDATAYRRFMKMFYDRSPGENNRPKYLLLFGGGTYDNRFIGKEWTDNEKKSMLLTYQSEESLVETLSYVTDDYFGFLDDSNSSNLASAKLNIAIGRLPVANDQDAANVINKIREYMSNQNKGLWQNNITYVADDLIAGNNSSNTEKAHITDAEKFSKLISENHPDFIINKIYEDSYERVSESGGGARYPEATKDLLDRINYGTLVLNYIGHGSTTSLSHENLLTYSDINGMTNEWLPLWITATCDFSRFDADKRSAGELALLKPKGGAIALFSTVRVVFMTDNSLLNENISKHLLQRQDGKPARLGDIIKNAKLEPNMQASGTREGNLNKLKFLLLGDPALRLNYPDDTYKVKVTSVNGLDTTEDGINIRALDNVVITGEIVDNADVLASGFNGILESVIFDSEQTLKTRGNTSGGNQNPEIATEYDLYSSTLFAGRATVTEGTFRIEFTAPKDIKYNPGKKGKMSFYAYDDEGLKRAQGSFNNYTVQGSNPGVPDETNPPMIEAMFLNKENFQNGDIVTPTPRFYAVISDDTGINLSSGFDHNLKLVIDGEISYDLSLYFQNEEGSNKRGTIIFDIPELTIGKHSLELHVWDVFNNSVISEPLEFVVTNDREPSGYTFEIWGNPAKEYTRFVFTSLSDIASSDVNLKISAYSLSGKLVWTYEARGQADTLNRFIYDWNVNGNGGGRLMPGIYVCTGQIVVDGKEFPVKAKKLIVTDNF